MQCVCFPHFRFLSCDLIFLILLLLSSAQVFGFDQKPAPAQVSPIINGDDLTSGITDNIPVFQQDASAEDENPDLLSGSKASFQDTLKNGFSETSTGDDNGNTASDSLEDLNDKRIIQGLTDKRFIKGLVNKRFINGLVDKRFMHGLVGDKRFMHGLVGDKRFMHGLVDKRFMHGLVDKRFMHGLVGDKRFINGLTYKRFSQEPENDLSMDGENKQFFDNGYGDDNEPDFDSWQFDGYNDNFDDTDDFEPYKDPAQDDSEFDDNLETDKRFMRGLVQDKRFMRGLVADKRFMHGLVPDKRFMRGLVPDKRFMRGLVADKRFMRGLIQEKRFMHGLVPDKRFIQGLVSNDKRFMRGLVPDKRFINGLVPGQKRFLKGLVKRSADNMPDEDLSKRFMRGLVRKSAGPDNSKGDPILNKKFMRGLVRRDDISLDKKFMRGLVRKSDIPVDKKFMRGLVRKSDISMNKKFMRGLVRKSDISADKKFMRGLVRKSDNSMDKKFMRGLVRKSDGAQQLDNGYFRFDDGLDHLGGEGFRKRADEDAQEFGAPQKKFMRGLVKKEKSLAQDQEDNNGESGIELNKKFMKGLVKKQSNIETSEGVKEKKFIMGVVKKESGSIGDQEIHKKFINGLIPNKKRDKGSTDTAFKADKKFVHGLVKKDSSSDEQVKNEKKFLKGIVKRSSNEATMGMVHGSLADLNDQIHDRKKRSVQSDNRGDKLMASWYNYPLLQPSSIAVPEKKFIRGLIRRYDLVPRRFNYYSDTPSGRPTQKRFIQGLVRRFDNDFSATDGDDEDVSVDKRFIRWLVPNERRRADLSRYYRKRWRPYRSTGRSRKRFISGLTNQKRSSGQLDQPDKRFILGLVKHSNPSWHDLHQAQGNDHNGYLHTWRLSS